MHKLRLSGLSGLTSVMDVQNGSHVHHMEYEHQSHVMNISMLHELMFTFLKYWNIHEYPAMSLFRGNSGSVPGWDHVFNRLHSPGGLVAPHCLQKLGCNRVLAEVEPHRFDDLIDGLCKTGLQITRMH